MAVETTVDNEELSLLDDCCRLLRLHCSSDQSLTRGNSLVKYNIQVYIYGQLMWPSFLYSSTQYGRVRPRACQECINLNLIERREFGGIHCSVNCVSTALAFLFMLEKGEAKNFRDTTTTAMRCGFLAFLP